MIVDINKEVIEPSKKELIIVDFFAEWCGPCKALSPILDRLSEEYKLKVFKVDVDKENALAEEFGIMSIPTVVFFKDGEPKEFFVGLYPEPKIRELIEKFK